MRPDELVRDLNVVLDAVPQGDCPVGLVISAQDDSPAVLDVGAQGHSPPLQGYAL